MRYTVAAVASDHKEFQGKNGPVYSYKVKFEGVDGAVQINRLPKSPAPRVGEDLEGTIDDGQYGKKFKAEYGGGGSSSKGGFSKKQHDQDNFTMYLSYAKDIAIACMIDGKFDDKLYADVLEDVITGGKTLYNNKPRTSTEKPVEAVTEPTQQDFSAVRDVFGDDSDIIDLD